MGANTRPFRPALADSLRRAFPPSHAHGMRPRHPRPGRAGRQRRKDHPHQFHRDHAGDHRPDDDRDASPSPGGSGAATRRPHTAPTGNIRARSSWSCGRSPRSPSCCWAASHGSAATTSTRASRSSPPSQPLNVEVVSLDWKWLFIYPEQGVATVNRLVVPAGTPVNFRLTSATVWNVFFVPADGKHDLHHAADDDSAEPSGRPAGRL